jgi:alkaline phosphatase D
MSVSRRTFLQSAVACLTAVPEIARAQAAADSHPFRHGVASGDPLADRVVLWTRLSGAPRSVDVRWVLALDEQLLHVVRNGTASASPGRDFTVKVDVAGLEAGRTYFYAFEAGGRRSPIGRTRTLALSGQERTRLAVVSCSNYGTGYFNVYRCLANRDDLDAIVHLGDYIYESPVGTLGDGREAGRPPQRSTTDVALDDYRARYAVYRSDRDLQDAHGRHPFIAVWDDHEQADNAWAAGAGGHDPETGRWSARRAAAYRAYLEWMPVRESREAGIRLYRAFQFGDIADLLMLDTRSMRDRQLRPEDVAREDSARRSILGPAQERWLFERLRRNGRQTRWRLVGQQVMFSSFNPPGSPVHSDAWEGYPSARKRVIDFLGNEKVKDVAILSGDVHSSWAFDVPSNPWSSGISATESLAVELVTPAISSPPLFSESGLRERMALLKERTPHLRLLDGERNGYVLLDMNPDRLLADWFFVPSVTERSDLEVKGFSVVSESGSSRFTPA